MKCSRTPSASVLSFQRHVVPQGFVVFSQRLLLWQEALMVFRRLAETDTEAP